MSTAISVDHPRGRSLQRRVLGPLVEPRTIIRFLHLVLMFPLGISYLVFFATTLSMGAVLIWTFIGPALILGSLFVARWLGDFEAMLVQASTGRHIQRPPSRLEGVTTIRERVQARVVDPATWTALVYLVAQSVIGTAGFMFAVLWLAVAGTMVGAPIIPLMGESISIGARWTLDTPLEAMVLVPPGLLVLLLGSRLIIAFSNLHARWAQILLGSRARSLRTPAPGGQGSPPKSLRVLDPSAGAVLTPTTSQQSSAWDSPGFRDLTSREREVLQLLAAGYSNAEIAEEFVVSEGTVKTHVKRVISKLGVRDRTQAVVLAYQHGILSNTTGAGSGDSPSSAGAGSME